MSICKPIKVISFSALFLLVACSNLESSKKRDDSDIVKHKAVVEKDVESNKTPLAKMKPSKAEVKKMVKLSPGMIVGHSASYPLKASYAPVMDATKEVYQKLPASKVTLVENESVSTFSLDVDTGSYANIRRFINDGRLPDKNAVRLEEMINYFDYQYPQPKDSEHPFKVTSSMMNTPWNDETKLLSVAIKGWQKNIEEIPPMNLVFLVDVSGSMNSKDKLPLVKKSLVMLTKHLDKSDRVAVVVYAGRSSVVLESTTGDNKGEILQALEHLRSRGGTNGSAGIVMAYNIAQQHFIKDGVNRVLLATDGDFNVGISDREQLISLIESKREQGIFLNTLGFGSGNYNDYLMEQLADKGNGFYAYIDSIFEAKKVLIDEISSSMLTIAKDVKIQLEFNPKLVHEYRLLGYENRALAEEDFTNDNVDAGEIGAGHSMTALYEISLKNSEFKRLPEHRYNNANSVGEQTTFDNEIGWLKLRYKSPQSNVSQLISHPLTTEQLALQQETTRDVKFAAAVAAFAQSLKQDKYLESFNFDDIIKLANNNRHYDPYGRKAEFVNLVSMAKELSR